jgi:hypothetical protein
VEGEKEGKGLLLKLPWPSDHVSNGGTWKIPVRPHAPGEVSRRKKYRIFLQNVRRKMWYIWKKSGFVMTCQTRTLTRAVAMPGRHPTIVRCPAKHVDFLSDYFTERRHAESVGSNEEFLELKTLSKPKAYRLSDCCTDRRQRGYFLNGLLRHSS